MEVTWLHISDFHFKDNDRYESNRCLTALVEAVRNFRVRKHLRPDMIFATGDIAFNGKESQYQLAEKFFDALLDAADIEKKWLFIVPGNHDVDRDIGRKFIRTLNDNDHSNEFFQQYQANPHITLKQEAFIKWFDRYFAGIRTFPQDTTCALPTIIEKGGAKLAIVQVNSALFCSGREDDPDQNKLWLGRVCLDIAIEELKNSDAVLKIALLHHPLEWLHHEERSSIKASLSAHFDCVLRGHLHETEVEQIAGVAGETLHLAAGAAHQSSKYPKRALYATFDGTSVTVFPIQYVDSPVPVWTVDPSLYPHEEDFKKRFRLPRTAASARPTAILVEIPQPLDVSPDIRKGLDSLLLLPESGAVPFHAFRLPMRDEIVQWALSDDEPIMLRLQAGEGGCGKTRLLIEVCKILDALPGWQAGFFRGVRDAIVPGFTELDAQTRNLLVVVDFAETKSEIVVALTRAALDFKRKGPIGKVRIVLLARDGGDWWNNLSEGARHDVLLAAYLREPSKKQGPYRMSETAIDAPQRLAVFREALIALATLKQIPVPDVSNPDLSADGFAQPLYVLLAALAVLREESVGNSNDLLRSILGHERHYWRELLAGDGEDEDCFRQFEQCLALLTLVGGAPTARDARDILKRAPRLRGRQPAEVDRVFDRVRRLYPWEGGIGQVRPDALGEQLIAEALSVDDELIDAALGKDSTPQQARHALTILTRIARRDPGERKWLERALKDYLRSRGQEAWEVGEETGAPMDEMLATALRAAQRPTRKHVVNELRPRLPKETVSLKLVALEIGDQRVEFLKEKRQKTAHSVSELVEAYEFLGGELVRAGKLKEALAVLREGLKRAERLSRSGAPSDQAKFAGVLLGVCELLSRNSQFDDALAKAIDAERMLCDLAAKQPGAFRPNWAASLQSLGNCLGALGRHDDALASALEAEKIYRDLAAKQPDAYRHHRAGSLHNLAKFLGDIGRYDDALANAMEAEEISRGLAANQPDTYRPDWAGSLNILASCLGYLGRHDDALASALEAERIYRDLAAKQPDAYRAQWANTLANLALRLGDLGRTDDALAKTMEAAEVYRLLADKQPGAHRAQFASSLNNLQISLAALGRHEDALAKAIEAEEIRRDLAANQPDAYRAEWGLSLANLAEARLRHGETRAALTAACSAVTVLRPIGERYANVSRAWLGFSLRLVAEACLAGGDVAQASAAANESTALFQVLLAGRGGYECGQSSKALIVLARCQSAQGETDSAVATLTRAIEEIGDHFRQRPRALSDVLRAIVDAFDEIDADAAARTIPADILKMIQRE